MKAISMHPIITVCTAFIFRGSQSSLTTMDGIYLSPSMGSIHGLISTCTILSSKYNTLSASQFCRATTLCVRETSSVNGCAKIITMAISLARGTRRSIDVVFLEDLMTNLWMVSMQIQELEPPLPEMEEWAGTDL
ncbi:hypothetical protein EV424DRAFT_377393 [Suillus variegatus]|nr:hypothetical protein EV424DRAFT_377393 [Suillus variegatus]